MADRQQARALAPQNEGNFERMFRP